MSILICYLIITYLMGIGYVAKLEQEGYSGKEQFLNFIFSPIIVPFALGFKYLD